MHLAPWYVRSAAFAGSLAGQVTVYVLLGFEKTRSSHRFFVAKNSDVTANLRHPSDWKNFGLIDLEAIEKYENNWNVLTS
jgi:hypothetical protein